MIGVAMFTTIKTLWEKHKNKSVIAKLTGHDWKTVSKVVKLIESGTKYPDKKPHPRLLDPQQTRRRLAPGQHCIGQFAHARQSRRAGRRR